VGLGQGAPVVAEQPSEGLPHERPAASDARRGDNVMNVAIGSTSRVSPSRVSMLRVSPSRRYRDGGSNSVAADYGDAVAAAGRANAGARSRSS
jgi:hypothetical protein